MPLKRCKSCINTRCPAQRPNIPTTSGTITQRTINPDQSYTIIPVGITSFVRSTTNNWIITMLVQTFWKNTKLLKQLGQFITAALFIWLFYNCFFSTLCNFMWNITYIFMGIIGSAVSLTVLLTNKNSEEIDLQAQSNGAFEKIIKQHNGRKIVSVGTQINNEYETIPETTITMNRRDRRIMRARQRNNANDELITADIYRRHLSREHDNDLSDDNSCLGMQFYTF